MSRVLLAHNGLWSGWRVVVSPTGERTLVRDPGDPEAVFSKLVSALLAEGVPEDRAREAARAAVEAASAA